MTQYIGGGLRPQNGPWSCGNCDANYFLLGADGAALQKQLDDQVNKVAGWKRFEVLVDAVAMTFQRIEDLRSTAADDIQSLSLSYNEFACWLLIKDLQDESIKVWVPYIFCDDPVALYTGRQIYGYPKEMAQIMVDGGIGRFAVTSPTVSFRESMHQPKIKDIISATCQSHRDDPLIGTVEHWSDDLLDSFKMEPLSDVISGVWQLWDGVESAWGRYIAAILSARINFVFTRNEFDLIQQTWRTSLVFADSPMTQLGFRSVLSQCEFVFETQCSHDISQTLGLTGTKSDEKFVAHSLFGASVQIKFELSAPRSS